jgi:hypothetical protein
VTSSTSAASVLALICPVVVAVACMSASVPLTKAGLLKAVHPLMTEGMLVSESPAMLCLSCVVDRKYRKVFLGGARTIDQE